jgi:hypothetical protein
MTIHILFQNWFSNFPNIVAYSHILQSPIDFIPEENMSFYKGHIIYIVHAVKSHAASPFTLHSSKQRQEASFIENK